MQIDLNDGVISLPHLEELAAISADDGNSPFSIPYTSRLSLAPLIERIAKIASPEHDNSGDRFLAEEVMRRVAAYPELMEAMDGTEMAPDLKETIKLAMLFLFPPALPDRLFRVSLPFAFVPLYSSPAMSELMRTDEVCYTFGKFAQSLQSLNLIQAGLTILQKCYDKDLEVMPISRLKAKNRTTGKIHYYKPQMNTDFVTVVVKGTLPDLAEEDYHRLLRNLYDRSLWLELFPPEIFSFEGFMFGVMSDVTEEESLSQLKQKLLHRDAILNIDKVKELADLLRLHFDLADLQLGLTALDYPREHTIKHQYKIHYNLLADSFDELTSSAYDNSIYHKAMRRQEVVLVEDLKELENKTPLEWSLIEKGYRSLIIAPLINKKERVIGLVELASPKAYELNAFVENRLQELLSLFRTTLVRSREDVDNRLEAIIRERYTSLHPSVEWRFMEAAFDVLEQQSAGQEVVPEAISFSEVYPLYGQADIVSSSKIRNEAIQADLVDNLQAARTVLVRTLDLISFPLVSQLVMEIDKALAIKPDEFNNSHETTMVELIMSEVNPLISLLGKENPALKDLAANYFDHLDPLLEVVYNKRRDYEQSVSKLNKELGNFFDQRDRRLQEVIPHYFEQYKTDGIEYEMYAGKSLLKQQNFSPIHLRNLRLSQLVDMADASRMVANLRSQLPLPLETAQLIFAYTSPLKIAFRMDEKRFDVEGAYNVRYEILKKRIDKATVNNGSERLTKPGHISIVYLHEKDQKEYAAYLEYLHNLGYVDSEIEDLELDPLQSVQGLRAFRFNVKI